MFVNNDSNPVALSISLVKALLKLVGFAPAAAMLEGGQDLYQLLTDISNGSLGNPNAEMIHSLNSVTHAEIDRIEADLKNDGVDRTQVKQTLTTLLNATRSTIKNLSADESKLLEAIRNPDSFADLVKHEAVALPKDSDENTQKFYERLLEVVAAEFLTLTPGSPNFNLVALIDILRCFPALTDQIARLEQHINEQFNGMRKDAAAYYQDLKNRQQRIESSVESLRITFENKRTIGYSNQLNNAVWGSRPARLKHWVDRHPTCNGTSLEQTIFSSPSSQQGSRCVIVGRAGSGKTSLAASIASRCESDMWSVVAWIDASTRSNIEGGLISMGESLLDIQTVIQQGNQLRVEHVLARLRNIAENRCLFVYDNVESLDYLDGVLPDGPGIHTIVTTRRSSGWCNQKDWSVFTLGDFSRDESIMHLLSVTKDTDRPTADKLASYLGDLPLAIAQAAATCSNYYSNLQEYYADLQLTNADELLEPIEGGYYNKGAITSLQLATKSVLSSITDDTIQAEAETILATLCYLAESGVPTQWLKPDIHLTSRKAYKVLLDSSIIEQLNDGRTTNIHRLLAHAIRKRWGIDNYHNIADKVCSTISRQQDLISSKIGSECNQTLTRNIIAQIFAVSRQKHSRFLFHSTKFLNCVYQTLIDTEHLHPGEDIYLAYAIFRIAQSSTDTTCTISDNLEVQSSHKKLIYKILHLFEGSILREIFNTGYRDHAAWAYLMLARAYQVAGSPELAIDRFEQLLKGCSSSFEPNSFFTAAVREELNAARRDLAKEEDVSHTEEHGSKG